MNAEELKATIKQSAAGSLLPWEEHYLEYHTARYLDTLKVLGRRPGKTLLDVGAFPGHLTLAAQALGFNVQGLTGRAESTPSLKMIADRLEKQGIPLHMADVETEPFPFPDASFDVVLASEIIEHLHFNPYRLLKESYRVLKPGGRILVTTPNLNRWENIFSLLRGRSIHSPLSGRFDESFSSILSARHVREYSASELSYMLESQNKEMYQFERVLVHYSKSLDPLFAQRFPVKWMDRIWPRFRSNLIIEAQRPQGTTLIHPQALKGFSGVYDMEEHYADMQGIARMLTVPFRWTQGQARLLLPAGKAPYQIFHLNLVRLVPERLAPSWWTFGIKDKMITRFSLPPDRGFTGVRMVLSPDWSENGFFPLVLSGLPWKPADHPVADDYEFSTADDRELGVIVGWDGFLREDCRDEDALNNAVRREIQNLDKNESFNPQVHWRRKHHAYDDRWSHLQTLFLRGAAFRSVLSMGKEDWRQLGPGWYFLENWEAGPIRWTSRRAEAYLSAKPGNRQVHLKVFTGDPRFGEKISGTLNLEYSLNRSAFISFGQGYFELPAGVWTDLFLDFPDPLPDSAILRLQVLVNESRVPARCLPDSSDVRELGLAVAGMAVR
ncbi:MAG: class I SAM-dependent methyltransferase [Thermodesulfobacteriota bacterium]